MAHESAELRLNAATRRYVEHVVGHWPVLIVAFLLDASVEALVLGGVRVDHIVLSGSEDHVAALGLRQQKKPTVATEDRADGAVNEMRRIPLLMLNTLTV